MRDQLWSNVNLAWKSLTQHGWELSQPVSPILPIMIGAEAEAVRVSQELFQAGFFVPAIRTPTVPKGKARLRLTLSALHQPEDILRFAETLKKIFPVKEEADYSSKSMA